MVGCAAVNCSNHNRKSKWKFFRFPADYERRKKWRINCRRDKWSPKTTDRLCEVHFEECQFESHRADNVRKLKPNAVPTLFDVKNSPPKCNETPRISKYKSNTVINRSAEIQEPVVLDHVPIETDDSFEINPSLLKVTPEIIDDTSTENLPTNDETLLLEIEETTLSLDVLKNSDEEFLTEYIKLKEEIAQLKSMLQKCEEDAKTENDRLTRELNVLKKKSEEDVKTENYRLTRELNAFKRKSELQEKALNSFLTKDQIKCLCQDKMKEWGDETILRAQEFRTHLGTHGYEVLRASGYPLPNSQTLIRHIDKGKK